VTCTAHHLDPTQFTSCLQDTRLTQQSPREPREAAALGGARSAHRSCSMLNSFPAAAVQNVRPTEYWHKKSARYTRKTYGAMSHDNYNLSKGAAVGGGVVERAAHGHSHSRALSVLQAHSHSHRRPPGRRGERRQQQQYGSSHISTTTMKEERRETRKRAPGVSRAMALARRRFAAAASRLPVEICSLAMVNRSTARSLKLLAAVAVVVVAVAIAAEVLVEVVATTPNVSTPVPPAPGSGPSTASTAAATSL
jgi:hypothetical protein